MHLQEITLTQFKNYPKGKFEFDQRLNCIVGKNGMGKTNLLDAIYYLCMGKSHFAVNDRNIVLHEEIFFRLEGLFSVDDKNKKIVAKVTPGKKKLMEHNDVPYKRLIEHIGLLPVVMIVPDDTRLATEGSEDRRRFLDNALCQLDKDYLKQLSTYNQLLKQRNAALKQFAKSGNYNRALIDTYSAQMAEPAKMITNKRQSFVEEWLPSFKQYHADISGNSEQVNCSYQSKLIDNDFMELTLEAAEKDRILARTTVGIHKDDLIFEIENYPLKKYASQGQLKSYVLAIKLALFDLIKKQKKESPIFLLDDIFDKLDQHRVKQLLELLIRKNFGQVFISDTDEDRVINIVNDFDINYKRFIIQAQTTINEET